MTRLAKSERAIPILSAADYQKGQIFLFPGPPSKIKEYLENFPSDHVVGAIEFLRGASQDYLSSDESLHTVLFVFDKQLPAGSFIVTSHQFQRGSQLLSPFVFHFYQGQASQKHAPLVILNETHAGGSGGFLHYRLKINDEIVAYKKVTIN